ncbi:hypothetical protein EON66_06635, partial [archaeon]
MFWQCAGCFSRIFLQCEALAIPLECAKENPLLMPKNLSKAEHRLPISLPPALSWLMQRLVEQDIRDVSDAAMMAGGAAGSGASVVRSLQLARDETGSTLESSSVAKPAALQQSRSQTGKVMESMSPHMQSVDAGSSEVAERTAGAAASDRRIVTRHMYGTASADEA